jgi:3-oxoacyl-[acyl-carrier-protein] synthase-1
LKLDQQLICDQQVWVGAYQHVLNTDIPLELNDYDSRNLRFALTALAKIKPQILAYTAKFDKKRLAIIVGTSTSGISDNEPLLKAYFQGNPGTIIHQKKQEMGNLSRALQICLGWEGVAYTISTACSSSAKAFASGQRLINAGLADAVLVGGVDTLSKLTLNGFNSLENLSKGICSPCGDQRDGINIGEAASFFLLSKEQSSIMFMAAGESMDGWHISAPHPEGKGAAIAMQNALNYAQLKATDIQYLNLHGTATSHNDDMEIKAVRQVFQDYAVPLSSTKHKTGHCLGAAGALEAYICVQVLKDQNWLPLHQNGVIDPTLNDQHYIQESDLVEMSKSKSIRFTMSNSFAFGGSNVSLIFGTKIL